jgi:hypothetical protein
MENLDLGWEFGVAMLLLFGIIAAFSSVLLCAVYFTIESVVKKFPLQELVISWLLFLPSLFVGFTLGPMEGFATHFFFFPFQVALVFYRKALRSQKNKSYENN